MEIHILDSACALSNSFIRQFPGQCLQSLRTSKWSLSALQLYRDLGVHNSHTQMFTVDHQLFSICWWWLWSLIINYQVYRVFKHCYKSGVYTGSSQHKADFHCSRSCHQLNLLVFRLDSRSSSQERWDTGYSTFEQHHQLNPPEEKQVSTFEQLWVTEWVAPVGAGPEQSGAGCYTVHSTQLHRAGCDPRLHSLPLLLQATCHV